jgi:hypothetical protein
MLGYPGRPRRSGRVAEGGALLRRYGGECLHRGFESLLLRLDVGEPMVRHGGTHGSPVGPILLRRERRMPHSRCGGRAVPPPRPGAQSTQEVGSPTRGRRSRPSVPCQPFGGVAERSNAAVSKTVSGLWVRRGFKSLPLRYTNCPSRRRSSALSRSQLATPLSTTSPSRCRRCRAGHDRVGCTLGRCARTGTHRRDPSGVARAGVLPQVPAECLRRGNAGRVARISPEAARGGRALCADRSAAGRQPAATLGVRRYRPRSCRKGVR